MNELDTRRERGDTAIDEAKTAELWGRAPRYYVRLHVDTFHGYSNVVFHLFHSRLSSEQLAELVVLMPSRDIDDVYRWHSGSYIDETFSKDEVRQLYNEFNQWDNVRVRARRAEPPTNNCLGYGEYAVGGVDDFVHIWRHSEYKLPFKVVAYVDFRECIDTSPKISDQKVKLYTEDRITETVRENREN